MVLAANVGTNLILVYAAELGIFKVGMLSLFLRGCSSDFASLTEYQGERAGFRSRQPARPSPSCWPTCPGAVRSDDLDHGLHVLGGRVHVNEDSSATAAKL